jgi:hypothetical protein
MAVHGARDTSLADFDLDPAAVGGGHDPVLHARDRFVRCESCGRTVTVRAVAAGAVRRAVARLAETTCERHELPDATAGDHRPRVTPEPTRGVRRVVCDACGRAAPLRDDGERALAALAVIPCVDGWSHRELLDSLLGPTVATPSLSALGVDGWRGLAPGGHGEAVARVFRHGGFRYTLYVTRESEGGWTATLRTGPGRDHEAVAALPVPSADPTDPVTRTLVVRLVTFLAATDSLSAGEFADLVAAHDSGRAARRAEWLDRAYEAATEQFAEAVGGTPAAFAETFADGPDDSREVLRRVVGADGFADVDEEAFAVELLGHRPDHPGLFEYVADRYGWTPPVADG